MYRTIIPHSKVLTAALPPDLPYARHGISPPFFSTFPAPHHKPAWQSSLFSFKRMNEDKKQSKMEHESHHLLWFMMAGNLEALCSLSAPFPSHLMESCSLLAVDTVKPSGTADYGAKYWSLPHMCQNSPHPLIRISPSRHTGTNRIYYRTSWGGGERSKWGIIVTSCLAAFLLSFEMTLNCLSNAPGFCDNQTYFPLLITGWSAWLSPLPLPIPPSCPFSSNLPSYPACLVLSSLYFVLLILHGLSWSIIMFRFGKRVQVFHFHECWIQL